MHSTPLHEAITRIAAGTLLGAALVAAEPAAGRHAAPPSPAIASAIAAQVSRADPPVAADRDDRLTPDARNLVLWIAQSHDNGRAPFLVVDKRHAKLFVFDAEARRVADSPILLGAARGDDSVPGIGQRKMSEIRPFERTTPAGRFVGEAGRNTSGEDIVWVDYDDAVSMHRVRATNPRERRLERLATPTIADNRISWGCINVPAPFFDAFVGPIFHDGHRAIIYVLPEVHPMQQVFAHYRPVPAAASTAD